MGWNVGVVVVEILSGLAVTGSIVSRASGPSSVRQNCADHPGGKQQWPYNVLQRQQVTGLGRNGISR